MGFITIEGENQIAAKQGAGQPLNIVNFVLANIAGLGVEPADRIEAMPIAGDIVDTLPVTMAGYVNTNQVVYSLTMDSSIGDYDFNWIGLVDDEGKLIAVTYTPLIQKRATAGAVPGNNLTRNFLIAYSGIQATAAIAVPAATWQIDFNARLHGIDERERLSNYDLYGHECFIGDGYLIVRQGATTTYDVLAGIGYVGGVRINNAATQQVVAAASTSLWLDVSLQGDISDMSPVVNFVIDAVVQNDYIDGNGIQHYLTKLSDIAGDGSVTDARAAGSSHEKKADPHPQYLTQDEVEVFPSITAIAEANALTIGVKGQSLNFRNVNLTNGEPSLVNFGDLSLIIPSGATIGTVDAIQSEVIIIVLNVAGIAKLAVVNLAGGVDLSERGLITTVAIDATADSANVVYSDAAYIDVPYRVMGSATSTQAVAGTWATAPILIQGMGGQVLAAMSSLGYGQTWQDLTASRSTNIYYYNTTGRPISVGVQINAAAGITLYGEVDGINVVGTQVGTASVKGIFFIVPVGSRYMVNSSTLFKWTELR